jgi:hypothetical protein
MAVNPEEQFQAGAAVRLRPDADLGKLTSV